MAHIGTQYLKSLPKPEINLADKLEDVIFKD